MDNLSLQTTDLENTFRALRRGDPYRIAQEVVPSHPQYKSVPKQNYAPSAVASGWNRYASAEASAGTVYGQPQFFSPVHTPINWQIPSKRMEQYQWARFFYENEPKVAASIDFYSGFPINGFENECKDPKVKKHFDKLKDRLHLTKWMRLMSHEIHLLGDCFPFLEIQCPHCGGSGRIAGEICDHEGGTIKRIVILNPDYVDVFTSPINPEPLIALRPDEELMSMVQKRSPGFQRLNPTVVQKIMSGQPIPLDNRNISHLKYGESGYGRFGIGMVRRLFPILSYKTKLMVAQWIVAERLIVPIKIVKVGSDERPAGPADIAYVQSQLASTANDPNLTLVTHNAFEVEFVGASGQVLQLESHFEFINQEILDGMMINEALLNGEGPTFAAAAVGIEAMIERLESFREDMANWLEQKVYLPEAKRQGFIKEKDEDDDDDEIEYIYPKVKWHNMNLRDQQQTRTFVLQLYEKGLLSAQTVLEAFEYDPDQEVERKRYDAVQMAALGQGLGEMGAQAPGGDDMGGGFGGLPGMEGGMPDMGGGDMGGGDMPDAPIAPPGGAMEQSSMNSITASSDIADPSQYGGKVLKKKTRDKIDSSKSKIYEQKGREGEPSGTYMGMRDSKGRIVFTKPERQLMEKMAEYKTSGLIKYPIVPQYEVKYGSSVFPIDFALPHLKIGIEADGEIFHSSPKQVTHDKERDMKLAQSGWTILRFTDEEIEEKIERVMNKILQTIMKKEAMIEKLKNPQD